MANINFIALFEQILQEAVAYVAQNAGSYFEAAKADALAVVNKTKERVTKWTQQLATGELSWNDFQFLIMAQKESVEMSGLQQAGLAQVKVDEIKLGILSIIVSRVKTIIG